MPSLLYVLCWYLGAAFIFLDYGKHFCNLYIGVARHWNVELKILEYFCVVRKYWMCIRSIFTNSKIARNKLDIRARSSAPVTSKAWPTCTIGLSCARSTSCDISIAFVDAPTLCKSAYPLLTTRWASTSPKASTITSYYTSIIVTPKATSITSEASSITSKATAISF